MLADSGLVALNDLGTGDAAHWLMWAGCAIFPCQTLEKSPATRHGFKSAATLTSFTDDGLARMKKTLDESRANLAIRTGVAVDVLDVDVKHGEPGLRSMARLRDEGLLDGQVARAVTPSGGLHILFPANEGGRSGALRRMGLDFKSNGGYVLVSPSQVVDLESFDPVRPFDAPIRRYEWTWSRALDDGWPLDWARAKQVLGAAEQPRRHDGWHGGDFEDIETLADWLSRQTLGTHRNSALYWASRRALESGLDPWRLRDAALSTGLTEAETDKTIDSALGGHKRDEEERT